MTEPAAAAPQGRLRAEVLIVLGLSLGQSAVYAAVSLIDKLTAGPLSGQQTAMNPSASPRPWLDLTYQLLGIGFALMPVALALWLLHGRSIGLDPRRPGRDLAVGAGLAALIGLPGLGFYVAGRALGITTEIVASAMTLHWWTVPVLVLLALKNGLLEEVVIVGYLMERLRDLGWRPWAIITASAVLRGGYHLYQGIGPFFGNLVMGLVFGWWYHRTRRVMPLVVAHTLLDVVAFVGYALLPDLVNKL